MTDKKYEFTGETIYHYGRTLKRIRRLDEISKANEVKTMKDFLQKWKL